MNSLSFANVRLYWYSGSSAIVVAATEMGPSDISIEKKKKKKKTKKKKKLEQELMELFSN